jgi:hypothetical protein
MKKLNIMFVLLTLAMAVSCGGDKKKSGGNNVAFYDLTQNPYQAVQSSVVNGLFNPYSGILEVGGQSYQPNQLYGTGGQQQQQYNPQYGQQMQQPTQQAGQQYLFAAYQQIQQNQSAFRPAYIDPQGNYQNNKYNVRVTYYLARYPGMSTNIPVLTAPVVAF